MATVKLLTGAKDLGATGSWDTGSLPVSTNDVIVATNGEDVTVNPTALSAADLQSLTITQAVKRNYGTVANPVLHTINQSSTGRLSLLSQSELIAIGGGTIYEVIFAPTNAAQVFYASFTTNGIWRQIGGAAKISSACALSILDVVGGQMDIPAHGTNTITGGGWIEGGAYVFMRRRIASAAIHVTAKDTRLVYDVDTSTTTPEGRVGAGAVVEARAGAMTLDLRAGGTLDLRNLADGYTFTLKTTRKSRILRGNIAPTINETKVDGIGAVVM